MGLHLQGRSTLIRFVERFVKTSRCIQSVCEFVADPNAESEWEVLMNYDFLKDFNRGVVLALPLPGPQRSNGFGISRGQGKSTSDGTRDLCSHRDRHADLSKMPPKERLEVLKDLDARAGHLRPSRARPKEL